MFTGNYCLNIDHRILSKLNTVPMKILKSICDIITPCLTNIINRFLTTGVLPDSLKKARVTPIPKEGDKCITIIIYPDFLHTPRRGSHVKSDKRHTRPSRYTP